MDFLFMYVNCATKDEAQNIGKELVMLKLAASASILNQTLSYYWWEGELKEDAQTSLILQVRTEHIAKVIEEIKIRHSYSMPAIMAMPITDGNPEFIDWMQRVLPAQLPQEAADGAE